VDAISSGSATRDQLTQQLATSEEWVKRIIKGFYKDTLGREPDKAGLDYWVGVARGGYPLEKIASEFYGSSEYFGGMAHESREQWVKDMYFKLMFRDADEDGVAYWLGELRRGVKRAVIAHSFYQSDEKLGLRVWTLYKAFLGHDPDKAGMEYWKGVVQARGDLVLATWLAASDEYYEGGKGWHR
jgi:hypothetical protein